MELASFWGGSSVEEPQWGGNFTLIVTESHGVARTPLALVTWRSQERTGRCAVTQYSSARCSPGRAVAALTLRAAPSGNTARDVTLYCLSVCILHLAYTQYSLPSFQCWFNPEMNLSEVLCLFGTFRFVLVVESWMFIELWFSTPLLGLAFNRFSIFGYIVLWKKACYEFYIDVRESLSRGNINLLKIDVWGETYTVTISSP